MNFMGMPVKVNPELGKDQGDIVGVSWESFRDRVLRLRFTFNESNPEQAKAIHNTFTESRK